MQIHLLLPFFYVWACADGARFKNPSDRTTEEDSFLEVYSSDNSNNKHIHVFTQRMPRRRKQRRPYWKPRKIKNGAKQKVLRKAVKHVNVNRNRDAPDWMTHLQESTNQKQRQNISSTEKILLNKYSITPNITEFFDMTDEDGISNRLLFIGGERIESSQQFRVSDMSFDVCADSEDDPVVIHDAKLVEDAIVPGDVRVAFHLQVKHDIDDAIQAEVEAYKQILGSYIRMPCYNELGSCTYNDICESSHYEPPCPNDFRRDGIPCTCPVAKGTYKSKNLKVYAGMTNVADIPSWLTDGHYMAEITFSSGGKRLACVKGEINLQKVDD